MPFGMYICICIPIGIFKFINLYASIKILKCNVKKAYSSKPKAIDKKLKS